MLILGLLFILLMCSCCACSDYGAHLDDVSYITSFPKEISLPEGEQVDFGKVGIMDIMISDSLMFLSKLNADGVVSVTNLNSGRDYGSYFKIGNGPAEFIFPPYFSRFERYSAEGENAFLIYDGRGNILKWELDSLGQNIRTDVSVYEKLLPSAMFCTLFIDDDTFLCRELSEDGSHQNRFLLSQGKRLVTEPMRKLNETAVPVTNDGYRHNILSTLSRYNRGRGIVVEASIMLNTIHMYSIDGSFGKTICLGEKLDNVEQLCSRDISELRETFTRVVLRDSFFAVMYSGGKQYPESLNDIPNPKIYIFDWDGNPVAAISLSNRASVFDIDMINKTLYTLDRDFDIIRKYDISSVLPNI